MEQTDVEKLIGELEIAVDRLRSLYEQYFVGIEKIQPAVPRKDVDRRIHVLRKEQIRNTALRFRFQMVLQRYNTYQTHWQRVCREIENGTYKRHLVRANRRFGSTRPPGRRSVPPPAVHPEPGAPVPADLMAALAELDRDFEPPSFEVDVDLDEKRPSVKPAPVPGAAHPPLGVPAQAAPAPARVGPAAASPAAPVWKKVAAPGPTGPGVPPRAVPAGASGPMAPVPTSKAAAPPGAALPPPRPAVASAPALPPQRPPAASAPALPPPRPALPSAPALPPPRPALPSAPAVTPAAPPRQAPAPAELSDARMRQIYVDYVDAKRKQNESTAALSYQAVAKSLRESGDKLRQKHGKPIDFEVAVKDGKAVLRPILK